MKDAVPEFFDSRLTCEQFRLLALCHVANGEHDGYLSLPNMADLFVEVRDRDIVVRRPETGHSVTYRRVREKPMLVALGPIRDDPDAEEAKFLVQAWKVAYAKAKALGWL